MVRHAHYESMTCMIFPVPQGRRWGMGHSERPLWRTFSRLAATHLVCTARPAMVH